VWEAVSYNSDQTYVVGEGDSLYRRSLYTYWKRQAPPPAMMAFDAPTRETCTIRRARTNTPLQALVLLNDVTFIEAARGLATRVMRDIPSDDHERARLAFRRATGRVPGAEEVATLATYYERQLQRYRDDPPAADKLLSAGESPLDKKLDRAQLAAWTMTATLLLNLDETITQH
jgi:hypothetical protein